MAYWQIAKGTDPRRAILGQPATYSDLVHALLLSRGKDPADLSQAPQGARQGHQRPGPAVHVHGGRKTPHMEAMATQWKQANMPGHWARRTGNDPKAIAWAMTRDG